LAHRYTQIGTIQLFFHNNFIQKQCVGFLRGKDLVIAWDSIAKPDNVGGMGKAEEVVHYFTSFKARYKERKFRTPTTLLTINNVRHIPHRLCEEIPDILPEMFLCSDAFPDSECNVK
jgi:hypothetical protein